MVSSAHLCAFVLTSFALIVVPGPSVLFERSVAVFTAIKLLGAAYLMYLGIQAIRHRRSRLALTGRHD